MDLKGRNFLTLKDFTPEEITYLLDLSAELKEKKKKGIPVDKYRGMNVALIFEKTSTRTRCSFEVAAHDMGMGTTYLNRVSWIWTGDCGGTGQICRCSGMERTDE